jgi:hypothetical protein
MFEMPPTTFSFKDADTSSWRYIMEDHIAHIEMNVSHLRDSQAQIIVNQKHMAGDLQDIKTMMANLLF